MNISNGQSQEKKFGIFFALIFLLVAGYLALSVGIGLSFFVFACLAIIFLILAVLSPALLTPLNKAWMYFGNMLGRIVSPIVLGLIFFVLITPVALIGRIAGRDPLRLKTRTGASYWIKREPPGPAPDSFKNQF